MTWKYTAVKTIDENGFDVYRVHEDYGEYGITKEPVDITGESRADLVQWLRHAADDIEEETGDN